MERNLGQQLASLANVISQIDNVELKRKFAEEYVGLTGEILGAFSKNASSEALASVDLILRMAGVSAIMNKQPVSQEKLQELLTQAIEDGSAVILKLVTLGSTDEGLEKAVELQSHFDRITIDVFHYFDVKQGSKPLSSEELEKVAEMCDKRFDDLLGEAEAEADITDDEVMDALSIIQAAAANRLGVDKAEEIISDITEAGIKILNYNEQQANTVREYINNMLKVEQSKAAKA